MSAYAAAGRIAELAVVLMAKILLLQQLDHRVKNGLTLITALLRFQARTVENPAMSTKLETMLERVDAVATVHRRTSQSHDMRRFDVSAFAGDLVSDVIGISGRRDVTPVAMFPANSCHFGGGSAALDAAASYLRSRLLSFRQ